ncbi:DUF5392 family protein [Priestia filamentosa]|uniref:DUF5392 family protein n=1 Tax=Priestia filamentosa TaxID=1402861 RepID=UPI000A084A82|nr:DUF5392 family protein [Priestia filamentosa]MDT3765840.1 DUF5392 family protein [Priestia filamentosa]OXS65283.1 hypothetical protein B1B01_23390 [Priestia filamentosa]SMF70048.1 hypothetical protein SAMN06296056_11173 [Priestia filamentosa]
MNVRELEAILDKFNSFPEFTEEENKKYQDEISQLRENDADIVKDKKKYERLGKTGWIALPITIAAQPILFSFNSPSWVSFIPWIVLCFSLACTVEVFRKVREGKKKRKQYILNRIKNSNILNENRKENFLKFIEDKKEDPLFEFSRFIMEEITKERLDK